MVNLETLSGVTVGQYTLRERLGSGGMGVVYRARQVNLDRDVAIKILSSNLATQPGYIERFTREARTAAALEHAHIVAIYDYGTQQELSYVVMRLLTGGSLAQRMVQRVEKKLPLPALIETSKLLHELANALDYAHSQGVIHRDIKAGNIMFDNHGSAFLVDFGLAKLMDNIALTGSGLAMGTPTHMSPEQWRGEEVTPSTDQYALGVVIYELITGRLPFETTTAYALMHKHLTETPKPLAAFRDDIPATLSTILERAMAKQPEDRFPTVTAFAQAFERALGVTNEAPSGFFTFPVRQELPSPSPSNNRPISNQAQQGGMPLSQVLAPNPIHTPKRKSRPEEEPIDHEERIMREINKKVKKRIENRAGFLIHLTAYLAVNGMLWGIYSPDGGFPWPIFPTLGWGIGIVAHLIGAIFEELGDKMREREIQRELERRGMMATPEQIEKIKNSERKRRLSSEGEWETMLDEDTMEGLKEVGHEVLKGIGREVMKELNESKYDSDELARRRDRRER